jgi:tetratricopeptide (TPR) repeat protein
VFAGGFTAAAAAAVMADGETDESALLDALGRLVDKSLVGTEAGDVPRYRLLETLRLFALEKLRAAGEHGAFAMRHAAYFDEVMNAAYEAWETSDDALWLAGMTPDLDNVRNALDFALGSAAAPVLGISLAGAVALLWDRLSLLDESRRYLTRAEALLNQQTPPALAARLYRQLGNLWRFSDRPRALVTLDRARNIYQALGDETNLGSVTGLIGGIQALLGQSSEAISVLSEARIFLARSNRLKSLFNVINNLGVLAVMTGDLAESRRQFEQALVISRRSGARGSEAMVLVNLAEVEFSLGQIEAAAQRARAAVAYLRTTARRTDLGCALVNLATYLIIDGKLDQAEPVSIEAFLILRLESGLFLRTCIQQLALLAAAGSNLEDAARLAGWVDAAYIQAQETRQPTEQRVYDDLRVRLEAGLSKIALNHLTEEGASWSETQAIALIEHKRNDVMA